MLIMGYAGREENFGKVVLAQLGGPNTNLPQMLHSFYGLGRNRYLLDTFYGPGTVLGDLQIFSLNPQNSSVKQMVLFSF